jgi:hypothetical protein
MFERFYRQSQKDKNLGKTRVKTDEWEESTGS